MKIKKHFFFDVDNTLTPSRSLISDEMGEELMVLAKRRDVVLISGAETAQIQRQIPFACSGVFFILSQGGNHAVYKGGLKLWENELMPLQKERIRTHIGQLRERFPQEVEDENDLIEDRGCQVSFSLIGHNADKERKLQFDPGGSKRVSMLAELPFLRESYIEARVGGTTCIDYTIAGGLKGDNVRRLVETMLWNPHEVVYVGDAFYPGGNDESVVGVCDMVSVRNPDETLAYIKQLRIA